MLRAFSAIAMLVGLVLIGCSIGWPFWFPRLEQWTDSEATELRRLQAEYETLLGKIAVARRRDPTLEGDPVALVRLREKIAREGERRQSIIDAPERTADRLKWAGVLAIGAGVVGVVAISSGRSASPSLGDPGR